jgi:hypothetical protein
MTECRDVPAGPDTGGTTWREMRMKTAWQLRELDRAGKFAIPYESNPKPPEMLITPRGWEWDTYIKYEFEKAPVTNFIIPQPYQKTLSQKYHAPWHAREQVFQGRPRLNQHAIHRAQTATDKPIVSPRFQPSPSLLPSLSPRMSTDDGITLASAARIACRQPIAPMPGELVTPRDLF